MVFSNLIGYSAAIMTTISFLPQVIKVIKYKHTKDISLLMYIIFSIGVFLWMIYGIIKMDIPIIIANSITLILSLTVLTFKIIYK